MVVASVASSVVARCPRRALTTAASPLVHRAGPAGATRAAVLLGWTGGRLELVRKHEAIWHELGFATLTATSSIADTFLPPSRSNLEATAAAVAAAVADFGGDAVVPHVFSNGGVVLYVEALARAAAPFPVAGVVFDSAPSPVGNVRPIAAPVVVASAGLDAAATLRELAAHVPYALLAELRRPWAGMPAPLKHRSALTDLAPTPELYVFSDGDRLVRPAGIRAHAAARARRGCAVTLAELPGSPHCGHLRAHPGAYRDAVARFVAPF